MDPIQVKIGPIIGKVTNNSARILIEFDKEEDVTCYVTSSGGKRSECCVRAKADRPVVFSFTGLEPKTFYTVSLSCKLYFKSSFWTLREDNDDPGNLKVGIISCNEISHEYTKPKEVDLWVELQKRVDQHEFDYILHIGDQCYMDMSSYGETHENPYSVVKFILKSTPKDQWEGKKAALLEILREKYRTTWSYYPTAYVLANVPNLTICDDHELRDDWGFRPEDSTPGTQDYFYGQLARQVYYEYQRQLREDIPWNNLDSLKCEYYDEIFHGVGISIMEFRGCRTWFKEDDLEKTHLGEQQFEWVNSLYKLQGKFDTLNSAIFITPIPMFFLSTRISKMAYALIDDVQEHWAYGHLKQMGQILDLIRNWKERGNGREVTIVGGDVHVGGYTDVFYHDKPVFKQLVSSAINGSVVNKVEKNILRFFQTFGKLDNGYSFKHHGWTRENNFGIIQVSNLNGTSHMTMKLVRSNKKKNIQETHMEFNENFGRPPGCKCNVF